MTKTSIIRLVHSPALLEFKMHFTYQTITLALCLSSILELATSNSTSNSVISDLTENVTRSLDTTVIQDIATSLVTEATSKGNGEFDMKLYRERLDNQTRSFENGLKSLIKGAVKKYLPMLMQYNNAVPISPRCTNSIMKYIGGLTSVRVWAMRMLDATSKPASGIFEGTVSDFGAFDTCLQVELPKRNGDIEFRGQYCAVEAAPIMPPVPKNFSMSKQKYAKPLDPVGQEVLIAGMSFYYLKFRLGICVPSTCTLEDMQHIAKRISEVANADVTIPQCYVKEGIKLKAIHIVVIAILAIFLIACISGTIVEYMNTKDNVPVKSNRWVEVLRCFSFISNFNRLMSPSKGSEELKSLHGVKALTIAWVIMGHTYVWINFQLLRRPKQLVVWFNMVSFQIILNGWLSVEPFFFLSGLLTSYAVLKIMEKTNGKINVPFYILRRYIRLTPPLLLVMGLVFFLPLISSGPFWYERVDPEIEACSKNWWMNVLYISNWFGMKNICVHPTWYLSADFQLHVVTVVFLFAIFKCPKLGLSLISAAVILCSVITGVLTYMYDLPPTIQISSGKMMQIQDTVDIVHMRTFAHAGPYYVGIVVGYLILKYKNIRIKKSVLAACWCLSIFLALVSVYGVYRWNIGEPYGPLLTSIYAGVHRTTFAIGVAWVVFACITGHGGLVNKFLSSSFLAPFGRMTFMIYLLHSLVIWTRMGSLRERIFYSHYNMLYEYVANIVVTLCLTIPFYLLLEAPLSNLERLLLSNGTRKSDVGEKVNGRVPVENALQFEKIINGDTSKHTSVQLTAVKNSDLTQSTAILVESNGNLS